LTLRNTPDKASWATSVTRLFSRLEKELTIASDRTVKKTNSGWLSLYKERLDRDENAARGPVPGSGRNIPLKLAVPASNRPLKSQIGFGFGERTFLDEVAAHWAAIEFGSDHIIGTRLLGFGYRDRGGTVQPAGDLSSPGEGSNQPDAVAGGVSVVSRPIQAHEYIQEMGLRGKNIFLNGEAPEAFTRAGFNR